MLLIRNGVEKQWDEKDLAMLKSRGWEEVTSREDGHYDIESLKAEADDLGLKYHPNIGSEKLAAKIAEAKDANSAEAD